MTRTLPLVFTLLLSLLMQPVLAQAPDMTALQELPESVELNKKDVESFIALATKLQELGVDFERDELVGESGALQTALANKEIQDVVQSYDLGDERWAQVGYSLAMAYAAVNQSPEEVAEMEAGIAQMEQMKASMPAAQWDMMKDSMAGAFSMLEQFMDQPAGNLELAKRYNDELKEVFQD